jgi:hypothetical protein
LFAAGAGTQALLARWGRDTPAMQRRPLHMLMLRGRLPPLYAHCLGASANPRLSVTSHPLAQGNIVWHLGGQIAEEGVVRDHAEQVRAGRREIAALLPWLDRRGLEWSSWRVDRAEPRMPGGRRPAESYLTSEAGLITAWPTKLAFAPRLAADLLDRLAQDEIRPRGTPALPALHLPRPPIARPPWETAEWERPDPDEAAR